MNRKIALTLVLASIAAGSAFAETPATGAMIFKATMTRDQVRAELAQHRKAGVDTFADGYNQLSDFRSARTRAEVRSEFMAAREMVSALNGEDGGSGYRVHRVLPRVVGPQHAALPVAAE